MEMAGKRRNLDVYAEHSSQIYFPLWVYDRFREGKDRNGRCDINRGRKGFFEKVDYSSLMVHTIEAE